MRSPTLAFLYRVEGPRAAARRRRGSAWTALRSRGARRGRPGVAGAHRTRLALVQAVAGVSARIVLRAAGHRERGLRLLSDSVAIGRRSPRLRRRTIHSFGIRAMPAFRRAFSPTSRSRRYLSYPSPSPVLVAQLDVYVLITVLTAAPLRRAMSCLSGTGCVAPNGDSPAGLEHGATLLLAQRGPSPTV